MANNFTTNVSSNFNVTDLAEQIASQYQAKGFKVNLLKLKNGVKIVFDRKCGGINMLLGLGQGITATCTLHGKEKDMLSVDFSDGDWIGKIIGLIAGWFLCMIPFITAIIGLVKQLSLPKNIANDMQLIISDLDEE